MTLHPETDDLMSYVQPNGVPASSNPWFDRFYFNIHSPDGSPFIVVGVGTYPGVSVIDGYVVAVTPEGQRNLRLADVLKEHSPRGRLGPLRYACDEPWRSWSLLLAPNPSGVEFDIAWRARTGPFGVPDIQVSSISAADEGVTAFSHYFQSGILSGFVAIDGKKTEVTGWMSQRDRSRGLRRARDRLGMHLWIAAQMPEFSIGCNFNLDRQNNVAHCDGAVLYCDGRMKTIADIRHAFRTTAEDVLLEGIVIVELDDGTSLPLEFRRSAQGLFMAGGGYGGWHGEQHGANHVEYERWAHDGSVTPRTLALGLTQTPSVFIAGGSVGYGIIELALSRSSKYRYVSNLTQDEFEALKAKMVSCGRQDADPGSTI